MAQIMMAQADAVVTVDGVEVEVLRGSSTAQSDSRIVQEHPDLWVVFPDEYEAVFGDADADASPAAKDVRAWAKANGVDVPAKGRIPDDVVAAYTAAQAKGD